MTPNPLGHVSSETIFHYDQEPDGTVHGRYEGGQVRIGFLNGTRDGDELSFRYSHITVDGETSSGICHSRIEVLDDGRLRLHESWRWTSQAGEGTSVVEEVEG